MLNKGCKVSIREEAAADQQLIWDVNADAFPSHAEADLVDRLRQGSAAAVSLLAARTEEGLIEQIVGHILFSPVELIGYQKKLKIFGLAPMSVLSNYQNQGIGSKLVEAGLSKCVELGCDAVVVLGHPNYYPRFGFVPAFKYEIKSEYDVPDGVFMVKQLTLGALASCRGVVRYHHAFSEL